MQSPDTEKLRLEISSLKKRIQQGEKAVQELQKKGKDRQALIDSLIAEQARIAEGAWSMHLPADSWRLQRMTWER